MIRRRRKHLHTFLQDHHGSKLLMDYSGGPASLAGLFNPRPSSKESTCHSDIKVRGSMKFECEECGASRTFYLEVGVEDNVTPYRTCQPCPVLIQCHKCAGYTMRGVSGYLPLEEVKAGLTHMDVFAYNFLPGDHVAAIRGQMNADATKFEPDLGLAGYYLPRRFAKNDSQS